MKINSHLLAILAVGGAFAVWYMLNKPKTVETYKGYNIILINGRYVGEKVAGDRNINPPYSRLEDVKAWIDNVGKPADIMDTNEVELLNNMIKAQQ